MKVKSISSQPNADGFFKVVLVWQGREIVIYRRADSLPQMGKQVAF